MRTCPRICWNGGEVGGQAEDGGQRMSHVGRQQTVVGRRHRQRTVLLVHPPTPSACSSLPILCSSYTSTVCRTIDPGDWPHSTLARHLPPPPARHEFVSLHGLRIPHYRHGRTPGTREVLPPERTPEWRVQEADHAEGAAGIREGAIPKDQEGRGYASSPFVILLAKRLTNIYCLFFNSPLDVAICVYATQATSSCTTRI